MTPHPFAPGVIERGGRARKPAAKATGLWLFRISAIAISFCTGFAIGLVGTAI